MWEASFDRGLDEVGRETGKRNGYIDLADAAPFPRRGAFRVSENFRLDVKTRLKFDYETLREEPAARLCQHLGVRAGWPYADRPGVDQVAQGT